MSSSTSSASDIQKDTSPLWAYVTKGTKGKGGNKKWKCNYCNIEYNGSYSRVRWHLLKITGMGIAACSKLTDRDLAEMKKLQEDADNLAKPKQVPLPPGIGVPDDVANVENSQGNKRKALTTLQKAFNQGAREQLTIEIARMFYSAGLPFNLARNPYYFSAFQYAANNQISGFKPPGYNALRTTLLQRERANVERLIQPIKGTWNEKGVSIVTDGWTDVQRRPLINFMAASDGGPIFLKSVDCSGEFKGKEYIAQHIMMTIEEVGPQNVVQIITDNAAVCKAAGSIIEGKYEHIFWSPCVVHTLNLALKNICATQNTEKNEDVYNECHWITQINDDAMFIRNFILNHSMRLAIFNIFVPLKLLAIAETRFASTIVMLKRLKLIKTSLQNMVISSEWNTYRMDDVGKATMVREILLNESWWEKVDYILSFTKPIYNMLRYCDTDKPTLHLVYDMWDSMIEEVKTIIYLHERKQLEDASIFYKVVYEILNDRWTKSYTPLHCLTHSLNPKYYSDE